MPSVRRPPLTIRIWPSELAGALVLTVARTLRRCVYGLMANFRVRWHCGSGANSESTRSTCSRRGYTKRSIRQSFTPHARQPHLDAHRRFGLLPVYPIVPGASQARHCSTLFGAASRTGLRSVVRRVIDRRPRTLCDDDGVVICRRQPAPRERASLDVRPRSAWTSRASARRRQSRSVDPLALPSIARTIST